MNNSNKISDRVAYFIKHRLILPLIRRTRVLVLGYDIDNIVKDLNQKHTNVQKNVSLLQTSLQNNVRGLRHAITGLQSKFDVFCCIYYEGLKKEHVKCDLCGSNIKERFHTGDRYNMGLLTVYCKECGLMFTDPRPLKEEIERFYRKIYRLFYESVDKMSLDYFKERPWCFERASNTYDVLEKNIDLKKTESIFDSGCGEGSLLRLISNKQPHIQRLGTEPSQVFSNFAAEYSSSDIFTGDLNEYIKSHDNPNEQFDIIVLSHVLEHFLSPSKELKKIWKLLKPGGYLYVEVPNIASPSYNQDMFHIGHVYHFSPETLQLLLLKQGFQQIYSQDTGLYEEWSMCMLFTKSEPVEISLPDMIKIEKNMELIKAKIEAPPK